MRAETFRDAIERKTEELLADEATRECIIRRLAELVLRERVRLLALERPLTDAEAAALSNINSALSARAEPPIVICMIEEGRVSYVNATTTEVSGIPSERFRGRPVSELVHRHDHALLSPLAADGWTGEFDVVIRLQDSDKRWTWRRVRGVRDIDDAGRPFAVMTLRKIAD